MAEDGLSAESTEERRVVCSVLSSKGLLVACRLPDSEMLPAPLPELGSAIREGAQTSPPEERLSAPLVSPSHEFLNSLVPIGRVPVKGPSTLHFYETPLLLATRMCVYAGDADGERITYEATYSFRRVIDRGSHGCVSLYTLTRPRRFVSRAKNIAFATFVRVAPTRLAVKCVAHDDEEPQRLRNMMARGAFEHPFFVSCAVLKNIGMKTTGACHQRFSSTTATSLACKPDALRRVNSAERARDDHHMAPATPFRDTDFVFVAMELMEGNLIEFQSTMSVLGAASVAHEVARALAFTARRGLHYVDMKLSNILYRRCTNSTDRYEIRLCDIGSVVAADETPYTTYPCIFNMLQRATPSQSDQNARNGVWGVFVLFVLLCDALDGIEYDLRYTRLEEISDAAGHASSVARLTDHLSNIIDAIHQRLSDRPDVLRAVDMLMR